ncbi:DUF4431 domain-containing protein [Azotobacter beijerinckii]|uniref:DUF4431 domain-containing protein n=1 Tax=Azotobacter beijerinckii TaxID=170623 RepID=UPI00295514AB|nr:DUF4431 domain-containing protein [Azotobacter beijerinckii]MDV7212718.1 DUF4431 domain-containing protein [Azotobacter beijerinckii]
MKTALVLLLLFNISAHSAECVSYIGTTVLAGKLTRHTFPEQPNYESIEKGDAAATYFFVSPHQPICVGEGKNNDGLEPAESEVTEIQLVFLDPKKSYHQLRPFLRKQVFCQGRIYHAHTGHHHSPVLLFDAECRPTHHSSGPARKAAQVRSM